MSIQRVCIAGLCAVLTTGTVLAIIQAGPLAPKGTGGEINGQTFTFGSHGIIYELDAFLHVKNLDLNGLFPGTSARFSRDDVPIGLTLGVVTNLSADGSDLWVTYTFSNASAMVFEDARFLSFVDAEIDEEANTFFNEYGVMSGTVGLGSRDPDADLWGIDEPGFVNGTLIDQLILGVLDNTNALPEGGADDASFALGFALGDLEPGAATSVKLLFSDDGSRTGTVALAHHDTDTNSLDVLTLSGVAFVPVGQYEFGQTTGSLHWAFEWQLSRQTGTFFGAMVITNLFDGERQFAEPFYLSMHDPSGAYITNRFMKMSGVLPNGEPYLDITQEVLDSLSAQGFGDTLDPGESVRVTGIEVYDRLRRTPLDALFELRANGN